MKVICIGNYPPRKCGIATFTENLVMALQKAALVQSIDIEIEVIAMNDAGQTYSYPSIVTKTIRDHHKSDYLDAANYINDSDADICLIQHEYGIFGGKSGLLLLSLLRLLKVPIVTTFHAVLQNPDFHQKEVLKKIATYSSAVIVMSWLAIDFLKEVFEVPSSKIFCIEHGVPDIELLKPKVPPAPKDWESRKVMLTFGLIGRSKGIETAIKAIPAIIQKHPDFLYVVMGKTHPHVIRHAGEEYRDWLIKMADTLQVSEHIHFIDEYVNEEQLVSYLLAADIYITPYLNKAQITSGTLCYGLAGGCAVLSTPYWHAEEILQDGRGRLFDFGNASDLSAQVIELLDEPVKLKEMQQKAYQYGQSIAWPIIGESYMHIFEMISSLAIHTETEVASQYQLIDFPFDLRHLIRMTDNTGILQHAHGCIPNYKTGYCLDDNARALLLCIRAYHQFKEPSYLTLITRYLAYINHMEHKDGSLDNFMTYSHTIFDTVTSEDAFGRTIWALGYLIRFAPNDNLFQLGMDLFHKSLNQVENLRHVRGYANSIIGLYHCVKRFPDQDRYLKIITELAGKLCDEYDAYSKENWQWFESKMTYDNGLLPASLFNAYELTGEDRFLTVAEASTKCLESKCFLNNQLSLIGSNRWLSMDEDYELFAQQPIDAMAMVVLYNSMFQIKNDSLIAEKIRNSFKWFLGNNDLNLPIYDIETGGCNDGIEEFSINRNQGAESTIAYHLAWLIAAPYFEAEKPASEAILSVENFAYC
ncbi:MAG: glycosyltransferase [Sediminibacterium sp.]|nr:glycosyltransferase [Sediminibacterium sp.]